MGPDTSVDAIDISEDQLAVARRTPPIPGSGTINYRRGNAYEPNLHAGSYDIVFIRLVLCHLKEPAKAVAALAKLLNPGGRLVAVDMDLSATCALPPSIPYQRFIELCYAYGRVIGVDYSIGLRLHQLLTQERLKTTSIATDHPFYNEGRRKFLQEESWRNGLPNLVSEGLVAQPGAEALLAELTAFNARPDTWVAAMKMFAVVGCRPV